MTSYIHAYCIAKEFDQPTLKAFLETQQQALRYKDAWVVERIEGRYFIFDYGVVTLWQSEPLPFDREFPWLREFIIELSQPAEVDQFEYSMSDRFRVHEDHIYLDQDDLLIELAVSHGIAQSCKLASFETAMKKLMAETATIPAQLAKYGEIKMPQKQIAKQRGRLFQAKTDILLRFDLLDIPEFFWEYPELDAYYQTVIRYLELPPRLSLIQHKFDTLDHILSMLADEQKHSHSSNLEWIIIILIAIEIAIFFGHDLFKWF